METKRGTSCVLRLFFIVILSFVPLSHPLVDISLDVDVVKIRGADWMDVNCTLTTKVYKVLFLSIYSCRDFTQALIPLLTILDGHFVLKNDYLRTVTNTNNSVRFVVKESNVSHCLNCTVAVMKAPGSLPTIVSQRRSFIASGISYTLKVRFIMVIGCLIPLGAHYTRRLYKRRLKAVIAVHPSAPTSGKGQEKQAEAGMASAVRHHLDAEDALDKVRSVTTGGSMRRMSTTTAFSTGRVNAGDVLDLAMSIKDFMRIQHVVRVKPTATAAATPTDKVEIEVEGEEDEEEDDTMLLVWQQMQDKKREGHSHASIVPRFSRARARSISSPQLPTIVVIGSLVMESAPEGDWQGKLRRSFSDSELLKRKSIDPETPIQAMD